MPNPIAFEILGMQIRWYGICVAGGFLLAYLYLQWRSKKVSISPDAVADLAFWAMIGGITGARIFFVMLNWSFYSQNLGRIFAIHEGGLVFYGGFIGATGAVIWSLHRHKLPLWRVADLFAVAVPLGQILGRFGCFFNGCCYGRPSESGVIYPSVIMDAEGQMVMDLMGGPMRSGIYSTQVALGHIQVGAEHCAAVLPSQVFLSAVNVCIVIVAVLVARKERRPGILFGIFLIGNGAGRFIVEFTRGDYLTHYFGLTVSQLICIVGLGVGIWILRTSQKRAPFELETP